MNERADVIMGVAGIQGSLNGRPYPFATFGRGAWLDNDRILVALVNPPAADGAESGAAYAWRPFIDPAGQALELLDRRAFNFVAAGGSRWIAVKAVDPPMQFGSLGDQPGAGAGDVAFDASAVYKTAYFANWGLTIVAPDGGRVELPAAFPVDYIALPGGRAIWRGGAHGRAPIRPAMADAAFAKLATLAGEDWIAYWSESLGALVVQPDGGADGYVFPTSTMFDYDMIALGDHLVLASSRTQGEGPNDLTLIEIHGRAGVIYVAGVGPLPTFGPIAPPIPRPSFRFTHPISVYPFKAAGSGRPDLFTLGSYTEAPTPPVPLPIGRLLLAHDSPADWKIPAGSLRSYDLVLWELYRLKTESLEQSIARWKRQTIANLEQWPRDCGVIPMFYCQGGVPGGNPPELWTVGEVLAGLEALDEIANLSPRIKLIAPFAYDRANGIIAHPELRQAFDDCVAAAALAGDATLTPVPDHPIDPPIDPPKPPRHTHTKGKRVMEIDGKIVRLRGAGGRVIAPDSPGTGIWGSQGGELKEWRGTIPVGMNDTAARHRAKRVGDRYTFTNLAHECLAGADAGQYSTGLDRQGYYKPTGNTDAGELELWHVYDGNDNKAIEAQVEQVTTAEHPDGAGHHNFGFPLAVEVIE